MLYGVFNDEARWNYGKYRLVEWHCSAHKAVFLETSRRARPGYCRRMQRNPLIQDFQKEQQEISKRIYILR